ncbi:TSUP family transporter [Winogradskyella flava]|uniref:Probable membrane transporter protein n=1 Tax=Winogradskyella flava TaxID=1884876 RepID=A0A842IWI8_9FLAO|nr:TSUP family transporter [Winogradskyella flava]MBC2846489.1 TSUP family transporter [Winogradskyella flava]
MESSIYLIILCAAIIAYFIKGYSGFGNALIFISLGSLFLSPIRIIYISSIIDIILSLFLLYLNKTAVSEILFKRIGLLIILFIVSLISNYLFQGYSQLLTYLIITASVLSGIYLLGKNNIEKLKERKPILGLTVIITGGIFGGITGVGGPFYVVGSLFLTKNSTNQKQLIVLTLLFEGIGRLTGLITSYGILKEEFIFSLGIIPLASIALIFGNALFNKTNELFYKILGLLLICLSVILFLQQIL